jgi:DNA-binding XRE family transcriptional regulator
MERKMKKSWERAAMRIASARYLRRQRMLEVTFENGDHFLVAAETVLPVASNGHLRRAASRKVDLCATPVGAQWAKMRISDTGDVLEVPALETLIEIPWDRIRSIADPDFRAHWADHANERARRIGSRIRAMRLDAGLSRVAIAAKTGVSRAVIASLKAGKIDPQIDLIESIAASLGKRLRDFVEEA